MKVPERPGPCTDKTVPLGPEMSLFMPKYDTHNIRCQSEANAYQSHHLSTFAPH